jgi:hypothetical protein
MGVFQWENEKGVWSDYDERVQALLNAAYRRGRANGVSEQVEINLGYHTYRVCLRDDGTMLQRNIKYGTERSVQWLEPEPAPAPAPTPEQDDSVSNPLYASGATAGKTRECRGK